MKKKNVKSISSSIFGWLIYFLGVMAVILFINIFMLQQVIVDGSSMKPTLQDENRLLVEKISYRLEKPKRFNVVVFRPDKNAEDLFYVKRIIGLPEEQIQLIENEANEYEIYINGKLLEEDYGLEPILNGGLAEQPITLGKNEYFVMGDNRNGSKDSRDAEVGNVKEEAIIGQVLLRIWPFNKWGKIQ